MPKPSPSPMRAASNDPFLALDAVPTTVQDAPALDDASIRFPPLDDFSLLHDSGSKFAFDPKSEVKKKHPQDISQRVTNALADDAFAQLKPPARDTAKPQPSQHSPRLEAAEAKTIDIGIPKSKDPQHPTPQQPVSQRPAMVSIGTMTSPSPPSPTLQNATTSSRPTFRFPASSSNHRSSSQPRAFDASDVAAASHKADSLGQKRPNFLDHRSKSQILTVDGPKPPQSSFDSSHRTSHLSSLDSTIQRSKSANSKPRPMSVQTPSKPYLLRRLSREKARIEEPSQEIYNAPLLASAHTGDLDDLEEAIKIDSNVDFLKAMEEEDASKRKEKRLSSGSKHIKRASMPAVSLSGTKQLLAGRFGEAFRRFEANTGGTEQRERHSSRSPVRGASGLTPIAGSEATDGRSDDGNSLEESEEVPPEMRRELERRRLSQEEKRVADAAAAYRQRLAEGGGSVRGRGGGGPSSNKAATIQSKVQSLLDESGRASPSPTKAASGYSQFTDRPESPIDRRSHQTQIQHPPRNDSRQLPPQTGSNSTTSSLTSRSKPLTDIPSTNALASSTRQQSSLSSSQPTVTTLPRYSAPPPERPFQRPIGPPRPQPKPQALRTGDRPPRSPVKPAPLAARKPLTQLSLQQPPPANVEGTDGGNDDWETNFSKRYPDLSGLEMVETEIDSGGGGGVAGGEQGRGRGMTIREV